MLYAGRSSDVVFSARPWVSRPISVSSPFALGYAAISFSG